MGIQPVDKAINGGGHNPSGCDLSFSAGGPAGCAVLVEGVAAALYPYSDPLCRRKAHSTHRATRSAAGKQTLPVQRPALPPENKLYPYSAVKHTLPVQRPALLPEGTLYPYSALKHTTRTAARSAAGRHTLPVQRRKAVLNWANVCSPNILRSLRRTIICFLIELLVRRIWFGQSKLSFILNWLVMRCKLRPELAADVQQKA